MQPLTRSLLLASLIGLQGACATSAPVPTRTEADLRTWSGRSDLFWQWSFPHSHGNLLSAVWVSPEDEAWAAGGAGTVVRYRDAGHGVREELMNVGTRQDLRAIWGTAHDNVWVVGDKGTIVHWNGNAWTPHVSPARDDLRDIWGASSDKIWAVGATRGLIDSGRSPILRRMAANIFHSEEASLDRGDTPAGNMFS